MARKRKIRLPGQDRTEPPKEQEDVVEVSLATYAQNRPEFDRDVHLAMPEHNPENYSELTGQQIHGETIALTTFGDVMEVDVRYRVAPMAASEFTMEVVIWNFDYAIDPRRYIVRHMGVLWDVTGIHSEAIMAMERPEVRLELRCREHIPGGPDNELVFRRNPRGQTRT